MAMTPFKLLLYAPGFGPETMLHCVPSQCSMRLNVPVFDTQEPTAHTSLAEIAATPARSLVHPFGCGLETTLHCVPFQCSISACDAELLSAVAYPTAQVSL